MKTKITIYSIGLIIILFASMNFISTKALACQAGFTWVQTANNVITFTNTSTGTTNTTGYLWNFQSQNYYGSTYDVNPVYTFNVPGTYFVTLNFYDSFNNCNDVYSDSVNVTGILICNLSLNGDGVNTTCTTCHDGKAYVWQTGGSYPYSYLWTPTNGTTSQITSLSSGIYNVTVTDFNHCTATASVTVGDTCLANSNFTWTQSANNTIIFTNQGTGSMYWDFGENPNSLSDTINPTHFYNIPGTYNVCCYASNYSTNFCQSSVCQNIVVTGSVVCNMTLSPSYAWASCSTCANGGVYAYVTGGTSPYHYLWSNAQTTNYQSNLLPGTYTLTVTDANNCTASISETIGICNVTPQFTWSQISHNLISFSGTPSSNINSYYWNFGDSTAFNIYIQNPVHNYNYPGIYNVCYTVTTELGCSTHFCDSIAVTGVDCNHLSGEVYVQNASCHGCPTGTAYVQVYGGIAPFTYSWSPSGGTNVTANNLLPDNYTCNIIDAQGCHAFPKRVVGPDSSSCNAYFTFYPDSNVLHTYWAVNYSTGLQPLQYLWEWGDTTYSPIDTLACPSHTYAHPGLYQIYLRITDASGCISYFSYDRFYLARTTNYMVQVNVIAGNNGIKNIPSQLFTVSVYPNPAKNTINIHQSFTSPNEQLIITNILGHEVYKAPLTAIDNRIELTKWSNGVYFYEVKSEKENLRGKFIKQ